MPFDHRTINYFYKLQRANDEAYKRLVGEPDFDAICDCLTYNRVNWKMNSSN